MSVGPLFAIGGAEAKLRRRTVLRAFVEAAGGADARIVVIPTASSLGDELVAVYQAVFAALGVYDVVAVRPRTRPESAHPASVAAVDRATGVFMTGGNQLKLTAVVTGTPLGAAIHAAHARGAAVGGTSAGASILSDHMIAFGPSGATPKQRMSQLAVGLGLIHGVVIDQHFHQRNRYGRLMSLVAQSPSMLGIGVDEDTAAVIEEAHLLRVLGRGAVTIVDGDQLVSDGHAARRTAPLLLSGAVLHVLPADSVFDLATRTLVTQDRPLPIEEALEVQAAEADLRKLARDIASGELSPSSHARRIRRGRSA